jgi:CheY-like chemotaxis protein
MPVNEKHPIVLIDDDEDDRYIFQEGFVQAGCKKKFLQFDSASAFNNYLDSVSSEEYPSLVLLDLNMPVIDGREVLKHMKGNDRWNHIPVIVFTTSRLDKDRKMAYDLGANCFISKPSGYQEVLDITKSITTLWCIE